MRLAQSLPADVLAPSRLLSSTTCERCSSTEWVYRGGIIKKPQVRAKGNLLASMRSGRHLHSLISCYDCMASCRHKRRAFVSRGYVLKSLIAIKVTVLPMAEGTLTGRKMKGGLSPLNRLSGLRRILKELSTSRGSSRLRRCETPAHNNWQCQHCPCPAPPIQRTLMLLHVSRCAWEC